ncbi:hypothetical protein E5N77_20925 [Streptomyces sp. SS52]|nr:hypothetical protein E5N77_20925 [Streptomyces sp. SS52]RIH61525.1 hypothetical protein D3C59_09435 [Streptomyces sp. SHP22-7]
MAMEFARGGRTVRSVGFFTELAPGWGFPAEGSLAEAVRDCGEADESRVVSYLRGGTWIWAEMGAERDVLDPEGPTLVSAGSLCTDGAWVWREDLSYYLATYHLALPDAFVARVRELAYSPPVVPESRLFEIATRDLGISMDQA